MASSSSHNASNVEQLLTKFLNNPPSTDGVTPSELLAIYDFLMEELSNNQTMVHWFCPASGDLKREAATFMLRVFAYSGDLTAHWKNKLIGCLHGCCACVQGFSKAKVISRNTYFAAFPDAIIRQFYEAFETWEIGAIIDSLQCLGAFHGSASDLSPVSSAIVYHILSTVKALNDSLLLSFVEKQCSRSFTDFPVDPPAPGILLLTMHKSPDVRRWARGFMSNAKPIDIDDFLYPYNTVLDVIVTAVSSASTFYLNGICATSKVDCPFQSIFPDSIATLWSTLPMVIRKLPAESLLSSQSKGMSVRRLVFGHLNDNAPHFTDVLRCFAFLAQKLESKLWDGESLDYPQVVFDSTKDNPSFMSLLVSAEIVDDKPWFLVWFWDYLNSVWDMPAFGEVLLKIVGFLCGEVQHERFEKIRPVAMSLCVRTLLAIIRKNPNAVNQSSFRGILEIHGVVIADVAFSADFSKQQWDESRLKALELLRQIFTADVMNMNYIITELANMVLNVQNSKPPIFCPIQSQMWKESYDNIQSVDGLSMMLSLTARLAHVDRLTPEAFEAPKSLEQSCRQTFIIDIKGVNKSLPAMRIGLLDSVTKFTNYNTSFSVMDLIRQENVVNHIVALMFSPVEDLRVAAQTLVGRAFDVDTRMECFRALLENMSISTIRGIHSFIATFNSYAAAVPEACSVSQSLVKCMTDIIEALCESPDGLLLSESYLGISRNASHNTISTLALDDLTKLWRLMTISIAIIFKRTPYWSTFFSNDHMVEWMRDALIFGRDMLSQRRVFESAAVALSDQPTTTSRKISHIGLGMVNDLQRVLSELIKWLRLTDQELLHQSFALLQSLLDCFKETAVAPEPVTLTKLGKFVDHGRSKKEEVQFTRLDLPRISKLEDSLATFESKYKLKKGSDSPLTETIGTPQKTDDSTLDFFDGCLLDLTQSPVTSTAELPDARHANFSEKAMAKKSAYLNARRSLPDPRTELRSDKTRSVSGKNDSARSGTSESEDTDDEEDESAKGGLKSLTRFQRSPPKAQRPKERRQIKIMDGPGLQQSDSQNRLKEREEAHRIAMRLKPDISALHRSILSWNYSHAGPEPPFLPHSKPKLYKVPDNFNDHAQYLSVFEPLLLYECWSQIVQSKDDMAVETYACKIAARHFIDNYLNLDISITGSVKKDWYLSETDIVLLYKNDRSQILGKGMSYRQSQVGIQLEVRCYLGNTRADPGLLVNSEWEIKKVFSLSTIHREYAALMALPYYDLSNYILRPHLASIPKLNRQDVLDAMECYQVNEPQARAILSSMKTDGFTLIQGPPGTGKTSTICGLVGAFLSTRTERPSVIHAGRAVAQKPVPRKLLICAPSNAAIDEVAKRLNEGVRSKHGSTIVPKVVRVGTDASMNVSVKEISLDAHVDQKMNSSMNAVKVSENLSGEFAQLRAEIDAVKRRRQTAQDELAIIHDNASKTLALDQEIKNLNVRRITLSQKLDAIKDKQKSNNRTADAIRRKYRLQVLDEADIICSTLAGAGHEILDQYDFETVIIDEAAQAIELSSLIPLRYRCKKCVMVGDPQQLPPTVISEEASKWGYNQSLFVRIQRHQPDAVHLLSIQYRMHPEISRLSSRLFYNLRLKDGPDMALKTSQPWHLHNLFGVYKFYTVSRGREELSSKGRSFFNIAECEVILALYDRLHRQYSSCNFDYRIGVVSMYRAQLVELRRRFEAKYGVDIKSKIDFNTVDGFQGQEKDIIILSCVRAGPGVNSVGFLADTRRINVGITRSRSSLYIVGHAQTLERSNGTWKEIIEETRSRSCLVEIDTKDFSAPSMPVMLPNSSPTKSPKKQEIVKKQEITHTVPTDIATPKQIRQEMQEMSQRNSNAASSSSGTSNVTENRYGKVLAESSDNTVCKKEIPDLKRHTDDDVNRPTKIKRIEDLNPQGTQAPSTRRPKPKPAANLFIPKKSVAGPR